MLTRTYFIFQLFHNMGLLLILCAERSCDWYKLCYYVLHLQQLVWPQLASGNLFSMWLCMVQILLINHAQWPYQYNSKPKSRAHEWAQKWTQKWTQKGTKHDGPDEKSPHFKPTCYTWNIQKPFDFIRFSKIPDFGSTFGSTLGPRLGPLLGPLLGPRFGSIFGSTFGPWFAIVCASNLYICLVTNEYPWCEAIIVF